MRWTCHPNYVYASIDFQWFRTTQWYVVGMDSHITICDGHRPGPEFCSARDSGHVKAYLEFLLKRIPDEDRILYVRRDPLWDEGNLHREQTYVVLHTRYDSPMVKHLWVMWLHVKKSTQGKPRERDIDGFHARFKGQGMRMKRMTP